MISNPTNGDVYSIQLYVIKYVSDLQQVCGFLWVPKFPTPIKLTATFSYISYISWWSVLLVEETGIHGENNPTAASEP